MSTHIVTQEHLSITDTSISLLATCGQTRAMVSISIRSMPGAIRRML